MSSTYVFNWWPHAWYGYPKILFEIFFSNQYGILLNKDTKLVELVVIESKRENMYWSDNRRNYEQKCVFKDSWESAVMEIATDIELIFKSNATDSPCNYGLYLYPVSPLAFLRHKSLQLDITRILLKSVHNKPKLIHSLIISSVILLTRAQIYPLQ